MLRLPLVLVAIAASVLSIDTTLASEDLLDVDAADDVVPELIEADANFMCGDEIFLGASQPQDNLGKGVLGVDRKGVPTLATESSVVLSTTERNADCVNVEYKFTTTTDEKELAWMTDLKASFGYKSSQVEADGAASASASSNSKTFNAYGILSATCLVPLDSPAMELSTKATQQCQSDYSQFSKDNGQCVVTSQSSGSAVHVVITVSTSSKELQMKAAADLKLAAPVDGDGKIDAGMQSKMSTDSKNSQNKETVSAKLFGMKPSFKVPRQVKDIPAAMQDFHKHLAPQPVAAHTKMWSALSSKCTGSRKQLACIAKMQSDQASYISLTDELIAVYTSALKNPAEYTKHSSRLWLTYNGAMNVALENAKSVRRGNLPGPNYSAGNLDLSSWKATLRKLQTSQRAFEVWWTSYFGSNDQFECPDIAKTNFHKELAAQGKASSSKILTQEELDHMSDEKPQNTCPDGGTADVAISARNLQKHHFGSRRLLGSGTPPKGVVKGTTYGPSASICCSGDKPFYTCSCWCCGCTECKCAAASSGVAVKATFE